VRTFLFIYQFPKSNVLSFKFRMKGPLKESISCFLIRLSPLVLVSIGLCPRTQSPCIYHSQDSKSLHLSFIGLKVLTFIFHRTESPRLSFIGLKVLTFIFHRTQSPRLSFIGLKVPYLYAFIGLKVLCHLHYKDFNFFSHLCFQKTTMSSVIYAFKRLPCLQLHFKDFNVFSHLRFQKTTISSSTFQRLQCLLSFTFLQDFNVFCLLHFIRLQRLLSFIGPNLIVFGFLRLDVLYVYASKKKIQKSSAL